MRLLCVQCVSGLLSDGRAVCRNKGGAVPGIYRDQKQRDPFKAAEGDDQYFAGLAQKGGDGV